jgi:hypothetical protein
MPRGKPGRPVIKCIECGEMKKHKALGLCQQCYDKKRARKRVEVKKIKTKRINECFFETWTDEMAYVLGFWCADGYIDKAMKNAVAYNKSKELLEMIRSTMGSSYAIGLYRPTGIYHFSISNRKVIGDLVSLGVVPAKSNIIKCPDVPDFAFRHFLRGYFDGNGTIGAKDRGDYPQLTVAISSGSPDFLTELAERIKALVGISGNAREFNNCKAGVLSFYGYNAASIITWLYWQCKDLYYKEKHDLALDVLNKNLK